MNELHTSDCFSLCDTFQESQPYHLFDEPLDWQTRRFECSNGLLPGDFATFFESLENILHLQPSFVKMVHMGSVTFRPSNKTLEQILDLYEFNSRRSLSDRRHFEDVPIISPEYTFTTKASMTCPVYTRHPITKQVTKHEHPYPNIPLVTLSAHPTFVVSHAYRVFAFVGLSDIIVKIALTSTSSVTTEFIKYNPPSSHSDTCPKLIHSRNSSSSSHLLSDPTDGSKKRKRDEEIPELGVSNWLDRVLVASFDQLPDDDVNIYSSEPSKTYEAAIADGADWVAVAEKSRTIKRARTKDSNTRKRLTPGCVDASS